MVVKMLLVTLHGEIESEVLYIIFCITYHKPTLASSELSLTWSIISNNVNHKSNLKLIKCIQNNICISVLFGKQTKHESVLS